MTPIGCAATRRCAGWSATGRSPSAASASQMGRFETKWLTRSGNLAALTRSARPVDRQGALAATAEDRRARHGFKREPDLRRAGTQRLQRAFRLHLLSPAVCIQPAWPAGAIHGDRYEA